MAVRKNENKTKEGLRNEDPITGEKGSHPIGTGVGAVLGGAATGALAGAVAGPVGAAVGAAVSAVAGGYGGKAVAESIDPTVFGAANAAPLICAVADRSYLGEQYRYFRSLVVMQGGEDNGKDAVRGRRRTPSSRG